ncbi:hypothetical protein PHMEG_00014330 [Phytophthora megakarya]|uniref:Uncharacterized protein n=1 Tax=Phytophthora megakarya TaxID=4795 RepID=A0A225W432_9STRA|nr:hypothetical protein PHMEG_00014330 [Phytophthora megakarya]
MPSKKPRYAQELDALEEVLAGNNDEEVTSETTRIRLQLEFYRRFRDAVFVNAASHIESLDEVAIHALNSDGSSPPVLSSPILLLPAPEYQQGADATTHTLFKPVPSVTKGSGRPLTARSKSPQHKKQKTSKHKKILPKSPGVGQRAWYPPSEFQELHRLHYKVWMTYREVMWLCALYVPCTDADRRRKAKPDAKKARLQFLSANVETFGYYDFLQRFEESVHDTLMWLGGTAAKHSATTARSHLDSENLQEDLVTLFRKKDKTAYRCVLGRALDPFTIDENGYASIPELLEQSGALDPIRRPRLTTRALACVVLDVKRGRPAKDSLVGNKSSGVWNKLLADRSVLEEAKKIRLAQKAGLYEPEFRNIEFNEDDEDSDFEDENGQFTVLPPSQSLLSGNEGSADEGGLSEHESEEKSPPPKTVKSKGPPPTSDPSSPTKSPVVAKSK